MTPAPEDSDTLPPPRDDEGSSERLALRETVPPSASRANAPDSPESAVVDAQPTGSSEQLAGSSAPPAGSSAPPSAPSSAQKTDSLVGTVLAERYRITGLLGAGGMGAVYRAEHVHMRKPVALKVLHREMTALPEMVARFEREAVAAARIGHPNVAAATDFGRLEDGACYLVLEFVEGRSLSKVLEAAATSEGEPFSPLRAVHIARQVAQALAVAHGAGVVHRDLKPDNIMLVERDGDRDFAKVLDFGIAKVWAEDGGEGQALTQVGSVFGTPEYMSPEQAKGEPVDARSDLYSLGMILYEMLAGKTAFASEELIVVLTKHLTQEPPPLPKHVPGPLRDLVLRLLKKDPGERVQSAAELATLLSALEVEWSTRGPGYGKEGALSTWSSGAASTGRRVGVFLAAKAGWLRAVPELLKRKIQVGGKNVPLWMFALPITLLSTAVTLGVAGSWSTKEQETTSLGDHARRLATVVLDPELPGLLAKAKEGDREALAELRKRAESNGSAEMWSALGRGYALISHRSASVEAYARAVAANASLVNDEQVLQDLRAAAEDPDSYERAMEVALESFGEVGPDLVDAIYRENQGQAGRAVIVAHAKKLMSDERFRGKASPALNVALALEAAKVCAEYRELMPQALEYADERSVRKLRALTASKGCGFLGLRDCFPCLRASSVPLREAIDAAQERPAPVFPRSQADDSAASSN